MKLKTVTVGIDLDGVLFNFPRSFSMLANTIFGNRCPILNGPQDAKMWNWTTWYPITKDEENILWKKISETTNFWENVPLLDNIDISYMNNSFSTLERLNVYYITDAV